MAEGRESSYLSPLEEQFLKESETGEDLDQQLLMEREMAAQKLWVSFQDSATAVAHLFRDCQQQAGLAAWVPFHESASAVTQLYRGASEVCRQSMDSGNRYGRRKKTKEIIAWAKKKRKHIRREELLAFLLDKPYSDSTSLTTNTATSTTSDRFDDLVEVAQLSHPRQFPPPPPPPFIQGPCSGGYNSPIASPRRRALFKDDPPNWISDGEACGIRDSNGRKRTSSGGSGSNNIFDFNMLGPDCKRMRL